MPVSVGNGAICSTAPMAVMFGPLQPTRTRVVLDYHGLLCPTPTLWPLATV